jgi:hypothetical protein
VQIDLERKQQEIIAVTLFFQKRLGSADSLNSRRKTLFTALARQI